MKLVCWSGLPWWRLTVPLSHQRGDWHHQRSLGSDKQHAQSSVNRFQDPLNASDWRDESVEHDFRAKTRFTLLEL